MINHIIGSSVPKSGTILVSRLIEKLADTRGLTNKESELLLNDIFSGNVDEAYEVRVPEIQKADDKKIYAAVKFVSRNQGCVDKLTYTDVSKYTAHLLKGEERCYFQTHMNPDSIMTNPMLKALPKKIYVYRDFRSMYNSYMQYVDEYRQTFDRMETGIDQLAFQKANYLNNMRFIVTADLWKKHVREYIDNRQHFFGVKFEELIKKPLETLRNLAEYLEVERTDRELQAVIDSTFGKDLFEESENIFHKYYKHYNNSDKLKNWRFFFNTEMHETVELYLKDIFSELGYSTGDAACEISDDEYSEQLSKVRFNLCDSESDIGTIAVFGGGENAEQFIEGLKDRSKIAVVVDDTDKTVCGIKTEKTAALHDHEYNALVVCAEYNVQSIITDKIRAMGITKPVVYFNKDIKAKFNDTRYQLDSIYPYRYKDEKH